MDERLVKFGEFQKKSKLAKIAGRESELTSPGTLGLSHVKSQFKSLYTVDISKELEEWDLPFGSDKPSGATLSKKLPPLEQEEDSEEETPRTPTSEEFDYNALLKMMSSTKKSKSSGPSSAQQTLFVDRESNLFNELKKIRTGEDAISFFAKNGNTTPVKFLYCVKAPPEKCEFRPYDLVVVPEKEVSGEYYTISAQGVVHVVPKLRGEGSGTTFYSLSDWMHQSKMYNLLTSMQFFKSYLNGKVFKLWRENVRYRHYCATREKLKRKLFFAKPVFVESFPKVNELLYNMTTSRVLELKDNRVSLDISAYADDQKEKRVESKKEFEAIIEKLIAEAQNVCEAVKESANLPDLEDMNPENLGRKNKKKSMVQQKKDEKERNHMLRLAKEHREMLDPYIRLLDYLVLETLSTLIQGRVRIFKTTLMETKTRVFNTKVAYGKDCMLFNPNCDEFKELLEGIIENVIADFNSLSKLVYRFDEYVPDDLPGRFPNIEYIIKHSESFRRNKDQIIEKILVDFSEAEEYVNATFERARDVYEYVESWNFEQFKSEEHTVQHINDELKRLKEWQSKDVATKVPSNPPASIKGILNIEGKEVKGELNSKLTKMQEDLKNYLNNMAKARADAANDEMTNINIRLTQEPSNLSDFVKFKEDLEESRIKIKNFENIKAELDKIEKTLKSEKFAHEIQTTSMKIKELETNCVEAVKNVEKADGFQENKQEEMQTRLSKRFDELKEALKNEISKKLDEGSLVTVDAIPSEVLSDISKLETKLKKCQSNAEKFKHYQQVFEMNVTQVKELEETNMKFEAKRKLWTLKKDWQEFKDRLMNEDFRSLGQDTKKQVMTFSKGVTQVRGVLASMSKEGKDAVSEDLFEKIKEVKDMLPIIEELSIEALKTRHWTKIFDALEVQYVEGRPFSLSDLLEWGILSIRDKVEEISSTAAGEFALETSLEEIKQAWAKTYFELSRYRDSKDKFYITKIEDILTLLEDHQVSVQTMLGSRHVKEIRGIIEEWDVKLRLIQDVIDEWLSCQKQWMYLENIFSAPDIQKQLPRETTKFQSVDRFWRDLMLRTNKNPLVVDACSSDGLLDKFIKNNKLLDEIKKGLDEYLESKRLAFPRFYFLADDELLEILSQTRNPYKVQDHLRKCFDNMAKLMFKESKEGLSIEGMISGEREEVTFSSPVVPEGNVEHWLNAIEDMMKLTLYDFTKKGYQIYPSNGLDRKSWILEQGLPAQSVLTVDQVMWTYKATQAIYEVEQETNPNAVDEFHKYCMKQIDDMVGIVRGNLSGDQRTLMGALIVLDVHGRDVIGNLVSSNVKSVFDFEWSKQLRYYWEADVDNCIVRQTNSKFTYGYEYLGNGPRLVITPLTDKCYLTLTGALHLYYGGAPQGPAGTGKTETTKDLGKALAIQTVVFNCSDGLDVIIMSRFFSGLAQAGAWSCFDEFNRIDIEVLSVIAQQILTIQYAIRANQEEFEFFGRNLKLDKRFGVFITMNPGYAGRTELPDNLKALFRPVSMMIPDYAMIAEIVLFSEGFKEARSLARKMVQLYKLASEQLSKQDHYDFGMRAVKSVLVMAGQLRRKNPDTSEDVVLIRAMRDSNVPKFLEQDLPLFRGIIKDLFPSVTVPYIDYGDLDRAIRNQLRERNFQEPENFVIKIIQLFETMLVRHGNMIVGPAATGKTTLYKILAGALTQLFEEEEEDETRTKDPWHQKIFYYVLNPKAISMGELYGQTSLTGDFTDGIVPILVRSAKEDESPALKWIVFDGPVDSLWIESMNTVLDDNKMLCLVSGERIKIPETITMLFEVQDLAQASPATVSRCGMVYIDPVYLGWEPLVDSWSVGLKEQLPSHSEHLVSELKPLIGKLLPFIRSHCREEIPSTDANLVSSCLNLLKALLNEEMVSKKRPEDAETLANLYLIFALTWSLGANLNDKSREVFDKQLRKETQMLYSNFPYSGTIYDYCIDDDMVEFVSWETKVQPFNYDSKLPYFSILVQTVDTAKYSFLLEALAKQSCHVLFMGDTGVGKTVIVKDYISNSKSDWFVSYVVNCSAQTSTNNLNDIFEEKLQKPKKKLRRPPIGKKMIMFIDDVNMPVLDRYGSQPPVELLRQIIEGGFYDLKKFFFKSVEDVTFVGACAPPGGGRNPLPQRFTRHFNMIWQTQLSQQSMETIFASILRGFLDEHPNANFSEYADSIVKTSVETYLKICNDLLPTPSKSHYTFNLRDLSKVVQGILMINYDNLSDEKTLLLLWLHEMSRVFRDRLIDEKDRSWFNNELEKKMKRYIDYSLDKQEWTDVLFGDFMSGPMRAYTRIEYDDKLFEALANALKQYNEMYPTRMDLVFFRDAINHLTRISRILAQPRGNALLVGVGGSGRQSLAKLAASMAGFEPFSIEITRNYGSAMFREDLKTLLKKAGAENEQVAFVFSDTQIVKESFLEDINNILNTGEVPNLYEIADMQEIIDSVRPLAKEAGKLEDGETPDKIFSHYVQLCRDNLHIILAFSPVGEQFRVRCRQFPSIINCCTIDWYNPWPEEALFSVAQKAFKQNENLGIGELGDALSKVCVEIHTSVSKKSKQFEQELRRKNYTTPSSYLELINLYLIMLKDQQKKVPEKINKYTTGLKKLKETNEMVAELQKDQVELQKILAEKTIENEQMQKELQVKQADAKQKEEVCSKDEAECSKTMNEVAQIKDDCQKQLDEAEPIVAAASKALQKLDKGSIGELKTYSNPDGAVKNVINAVCLLLGRKENWEEGRKLISEMDFRDRCLNYPKEDISPALLRKLTKYVSDPNFNKTYVGQKSAAAGALCEFVCAMENFARINREVEPKREKLKKAEKELKKAQDELAVKQSALKAVQDEVGELEATFQSSIKKGEELANKSELTVARLGRAEKLVKGLGSESKRWSETAKILEVDLKNLVGNIMLSAGFVAYLGPFTMAYRTSLLEGWMRFAQANKVPVAPDFTLQRIMAEDVEVREWNLAGLPADQLSIDNAVICTRSRRWPLIIDPQGQANSWIKSMDRETLKVIKFSEPNFLKTLENGIHFGNPILLENVEETLDPSIDPVLQKQIVRKGGTNVLRLGDKDVPYSPDFRFYMTSKLPNPHYLPEICIKVAVINFTVTPKGLEDQLLVDVVRAERPELESQKNNLIVQISNDKDMLQELEDKILNMISKSGDDILDDQALIETLDASKKTSEVIHVRMAEAEETAKNIDVARESYRVVAERGSILYFVIADIGLIDPMYQYSLDFFNKLFNLRLAKSEKSEDLDKRLDILVNDVTKSFYLNICRGLFEKDKLLYSFINTARISIQAGKLTEEEWAYFMKGTEDLEGDPLETPKFTIPGSSWAGIQQLEKVHSNYLGIAESIKTNSEWASYVNSKNPFEETVPAGYESILSSFQRFLLGNLVKSEIMIQGVKKYIKEELGEFFIESPPFDLKGAYEDSNCLNPIIFVLSPGADPISDLLKLAAENEMDGRFRMLSLGQGQGKLAEKYIDNGRRNGDWVCLQNCHLAASWMGELERIQEEQVESDIHPEYRLWLTSEPSKNFPVPVLQSGIKLTNEPPKGLKANLGRTFQDVTEENYLGCAKSMEYKKLLFSLAFFHAVILERRKFGAIGWNIPYEWMTSDFVTSKMQLFMYLNEQEVIPYGTLKVLVAEINYGGRVTDDKDVRLIKALLDKYFTPEVMNPTYTFSMSGIYKCPEAEALEDVKDYIKSLPLDDDPEVFGLHSNANITFNQKTVKEFRETLTSIHPKVSAGNSGKSPDEVVNDIAKDIEARIPPLMDVENEQHPDTFAKNEEGAINSLGVFIGQEIVRFNQLLKVVKNSLAQLQKAIRGDVVMGPDLESMYKNFLNQKIPEIWSEIAYPSLKPLGSWVKDLIERVNFIHDWLTKGPQPAYWLSSFFFPQGFMTAALQMYARQTKTPIDTLKFKTVVKDKFKEDIHDLPEVGVNIYGLFMQGAKWDFGRGRIEESDPAVLFIEMPVILLEPVTLEVQPKELVYNAPLYKTSLRAGTLSTTGHSTNFVLFLEIPTINEAVHWIRRGVALLCQLDD